MKRAFKGLFALFFLSLIVSIAASVFNSCNQDTTDEHSYTTVKDNGKDFVNFIVAQKEALMQTRLNPIHPDTRGTSDDWRGDWGTDNGLDNGSGNGNTRIDGPFSTIYITPPEPDFKIDEELMGRFRAAQTIEDLIRIEHEFCINFTVFRPGTPVDSIVIPDEAVKRSMSPMVERSRKYLIGKGFTNDEIDAILVETGASEEELVPIVTYIAADESASSTAYNYQTSYSLFAQPCFAATNPKLQAAFDCAVKAMDYHLIMDIAKGMASRVWTKNLIQKALKKVLIKRLGVVGAAITVTEFIFCLADNDVFS